MPWSTNDYPPSMKNLDSKVRNKAIEIANALLREGYEEGRAISIATSQAHVYIEGKSEGRRHYEVKPCEDEWVMKKAGSGHAILKDSTKTALLDKAKKYAVEHDAILSIFHADGSHEKTMYE